MSIETITKGVIIGFSVAAPVGPIGVLCIKRTLYNGIPAGIMTGLGATVADALYGAIAGFGLIAITSMLIAFEGWMKFIGGLFLIYLGVQAFRSTPSTNEAVVANKKNDLIGNFLSTFVLTLTNPLTILSFLAIFAGMSNHTHYSSATDSFALVSGVVIGSALWWLTLSACVGFFRHKVSGDHLRLVNKGSGVVLFAFGLLSLGTLAQNLLH